MFVKVNEVILHHMNKQAANPDDNTDENVGWYIARTDGAIGAGPFVSRREAEANTKFFQWYTAATYDIAYGTIDEWGGFVMIEPQPQQP